jgi:16S rRNA (cytidine1402-2'-O)-methyltransferase
MSGSLFVVATPIGNLEDITLRALRVLREVDLIAAEDTRRTAKLLAHFAIATKTTSFHAHNARSRLPVLLDRLRTGASVALVTDAGTPGVSDPGVELVAACVREGIRIDPIPGASAPVAAAVASGFPIEPLTILGFAPSKQSARRQWFTSVAAIRHTVTYFESPHRIQASLADAASLLGDRPIVVAREVTKAHQEFVRGSAQSLVQAFDAPLGEFTIVVGPAQAAENTGDRASDAELADYFGLMANIDGVSRRQAIASVAKRFGVPSRRVYTAVENSKLSGK